MLNEDSNKINITKLTFLISYIRRIPGYVNIENNNKFQEKQYFNTDGILNETTFKNELSFLNNLNSTNLSDYSGNYIHIFSKNPITSETNSDEYI